MRTKMRDFANLGIGLLIFGMLAWLNGRAGSDHLRLILVATIVALAAFLLWDYRESLWRPPTVVALSAIALVMVFLTSPSVNTQIFEEFMALAIGAAFVWLLVWLFVRIAFPRTKAKYEALPVLLLSCALSFGLAVCSLGAWLKAVDLNALPKNAVATTGAELASLWELSWGKRYNGIFAVGRIGEPEKRNATEGGDYLAYYNAARPLGFSADFASLLPSSYVMTMADGAAVSVQGVARRTQTTNWPDCGPYVFQHCLRQGDPVVIWADPGELRALGSGKQSNALNATRVIAYGSLEDFRAGYLARAVATARVFGWIALAFVPLSLLPAFLGWRRWRWLRRHGTDEPSRITITRA
ncbi:hypothetical protein [Hoeflea alexandrii]|uniref:hypothetical protein n=1 Tax=Hoeflea alexandrii TaxID=288436 RepID=UPI0022AE6046|nr:hypothetical protein [Hoeflea alexandrii]MCZ4291535.1 hypothetical protein [Hoeflea alexandrii]